jgi:bifunctional DNase/RNase
MDTRVKLKVKGVTDKDVKAGAYALVLAETNGKRELPIIIGTSEAQAILMAVEKIDPPRPLTHDLFHTLFAELSVDLQDVCISRYEDGVFYAEMRLCVGAGSDTRELVVDTRPSDAIAIALRMKCDIFVSSGIINNKELALAEHETDGVEFYKSENHDGEVELDFEYDDAGDEEEEDDDIDEDEDDDFDEDFEENADTLLSLMDSLISREDATLDLLKPIAEQSIDALNNNMSLCIRCEDYERAQVYRDEILRRGAEPRIDDDFDKPLEMPF